MFGSKEAVLIGAGLSKPVGIPAMRGLAQSFRQSLRVSDDAYDAYRLLRSFGVGEDVEDILQTITLIRQYHDTPLEGYVDSAIAPTGSSAKLSQIHEREQDNLEVIDLLEDTLLDYIRQTCFTFDRSKALTTYSNLVMALSENNIPVFTTNYDFVLEHVAAEIGREVVDNFENDGSGRHFWDPTLAAFQKKGFRIVKIHGSLQWYVDETGRIERIPFLAQMNPEGQPLEDLVIFPTRFKDIYERNYFALYSVFLRSLEQVELLVIVGHSLRDEYIRAAVRERVRRGDVTVVVIDPGQPLLQDIQEAAKSGNPGSEVVQYEWDAETVAPLLADGLERMKPAELTDYFDAADEILSRKRVHYDSIKVKSPPQWLTPGEVILMRVEGQFTVGGGRLYVWLDVNRQKSNRRELRWNEVESGDNKLDGIIQGYRTIDAEIEVQIPENLPRKGHRLGVGLVVSPQGSEDSSVLVEKSYKVRTTTR